MNKTVRFGVVGCGAIGPTHLGALRRIAGVEIVAVADVIAERARATAKTFDIPGFHVGADADRALFARPDIDAVCLCTPSGTHAAGAVAALEAGKHVLVEKPMEVSLEACDRMIAAAAQSGKKLAVVSQHRWDRATRVVKEAIDAGKLGRILCANAAVRWWRTQEYYDSGDWRGTWAMDGGGALMNQGIHTVDLLQWLAGGVVSLSAQTRTAAHERIEVEDIAAATLVFENGAVGTLLATTAAWPGFPARIEIYGTEGAAVIEGDGLQFLQFKQGDASPVENAATHAVAVAQGGTASVKDQASTGVPATNGADSGTVWGDAHRAQIEDFIAAIRTDGKPLIDGHAGRKPLEIILGVYRSSQSGGAATFV